MLDIPFDIKELFGTVAMISASLGIFFEVAPIKVNPISCILKYMGRVMNEELRTEVSEIRRGLSNLDYKVDANEIDRIRWEILDFANGCRTGKRHTKEEFQHIIELNTKYHGIIDDKGIENGQIKLEYGFIESLYNKCLRENSFLCSNGIDEDC